LLRSVEFRIKWRDKELGVDADIRECTGHCRFAGIELNTLRLSQQIKPVLLDNNFSNLPAYPDAYTAWSKMLVFGAAVGSVALALSAAWGFGQLSARGHGVPSRRTMATLFPYVTLAVATCQWMSAWALTSQSPLMESHADRLGAAATARWRTGVIRFVVTASYIILALRLWGIVGSGLRPSFNSLSGLLIAQASDAIVTILLWLHLRSVARAQGLRWLVSRSVVIVIGRGGTLIFLFVIPLALEGLGYPLRLSWQFNNIRSSLAVLWDSIALLFLIQFAAAFLGNVRRGQ